MGYAATFNFAQWQAAFPALAYVSQAQAQAQFNIAGEFYLRNDGSGPNFKTPQVQSDLLNLITAHLCQLFVPNPAAGAPQAAMVGRISSASQGSVSVTAEYAAETSQSMAWWVQTQYGAAYWNAMNARHAFRYVPARPRTFDLPWPSYF